MTLGTPMSLKEYTEWNSYEIQNKLLTQNSAGLIHAKWWKNIFGITISLSIDQSIDRTKQQTINQSIDQTNYHAIKPK